MLKFMMINEELMMRYVITIVNASTQLRTPRQISVRQIQSLQYRKQGHTQSLLTLLLLSRSPRTIANDDFTGNPSPDTLLRHAQSTKCHS